MRKDDKIGLVLLIISGIVGLFYFYLWCIFNRSPYGLFELISFYLGAIWCFFMVVACRKLKMFEDKDGVKE